MLSRQVSGTYSEYYSNHVSRFMSNSDCRAGKMHRVVPVCRLTPVWRQNLISARFWTTYNTIICFIPYLLHNYKVLLYGTWRGEGGGAPVAYACHCWIVWYMCNLDCLWSLCRKHSTQTVPCCLAYLCSINHQITQKLNARYTAHMWF